MSFFIKLFLGCLFVLVAICTCPNSCSGHGSCGQNGVCKCDNIASTGWGSALNAGYTGPDCSLRTCPVGASIQTIPVVFRGTIYPHPIDGKRRLFEELASTLPEGFPLINTFKVNTGKITGMGVEGGILRCNRADNGANLGTANVLAYDDQDTAIIQYNFNLTKASPVKENMTEVEDGDEEYDYGDYISNTVCSVYSTRNDMTYYKSLTRTETTTEGGSNINSWAGYNEILKVMKWKSETTTTAADEGATIADKDKLKAVCYLNGTIDTTPTPTPTKLEEIYKDGKAYVYYGDLTVTLNNNGKDVDFSINFADGNLLTEKTVCYIMAKGTGEVITKDNLGTTDLAKKLKKDDKGDWYYEIISNTNYSVVETTGETVEMKLPVEKVESIITKLQEQAKASGGDNADISIISQPNVTLPLPATPQERAVIEMISMPGTPVTIDFGDAGKLPNTIIGVKTSDDSGSGDRRLLSEIKRELVDATPGPGDLNSYQSQTYLFYENFPANGITNFEIVFNKVGGVHSPIECSGQGLCNRETGSCECYNGFTGEACQRMSCPNDCNNHGKCVSSLADKYEAYGEKNEMIYYCKCDAGFRGPDCSLKECPSSNIDRDCSNNGLCDYSIGLCNCFDGFYGEGCQHTIGIV